METKDILSKYAYYYDYIQMLGTILITEEGNEGKTGRALMHFIKRGAEDRAYKEIKELKFIGSLREYLWWIGILYLFLLCKNTGSKTLFDVSENVIKFKGLKKELTSLSRASMQNPNLIRSAFFEVFGRELKDDELNSIIELFYTKIGKNYWLLSKN